MGAMFGLFILAMIVGLLIIVIIVVSMWKIFTKARQPGWAAIIPIYNTYILVLVARLPIYYFIVLALPTLLAIARIQVPSPGDSIINLIYFVGYVCVVYNVAKQFGKGIGYTLGMVFLPFIFYPMLAFGDSVYQGAESAEEDGMMSDDQDASVPSTEQAPIQEVEQPLQQDNVQAKEESTSKQNTV